MAAYDVSCYFLLQTENKSPTVRRLFTLGTSDYSDRVLRWPKFKTKWNDIRPTSLTIGLANEDQLFNFMTTDPTNMRSEAKIQIGFDHPGQNIALHSEAFDSGSWDQIGVDSAVYDGQVAPNGQTVADAISFGTTTVNSNSIIQYLNNVVATPSIPYTYSVYAKVIDTIVSSDLQIEMRLGFGGSVGAKFIGADITSDWQRFSMTLTAGADVTSVQLGIRTQSYGGTIGLWGAQLNEGTVAQEYFRTVDSVHTAGDPELITMFAGTTERAKFDRGMVNLSMKDKIKVFTEKIVGVSDVPVEFIGSSYLPSDIAWWLSTSYGGLSAVESVTNPDIDYESFQNWASVFSEDSVFVQARYEGKKINEALRSLGRYTGSTLSVENNKLTFNRFTDVSPFITNLGENVKRVALTVDDSIIVNRHHTFADYDVTSDFWKIDVLAENSVSVNSYGLREQVEKEKTIWYVNSSSAQNFSQRRLSTNGVPFDSYEISIPLNALARQLGESLTFTDSFFNETGSNVFRIMETQIDLEKGEMKVSVDGSQSLQGFILDDVVNGLLDQTYNFLL